MAPRPPPFQAPTAPAFEDTTAGKTPSGTPLVWQQVGELLGLKMEHCCIKRLATRLGEPSMDVSNEILCLAALCLNCRLC